MTVDKAELAGTGAAILFHAALIGALSIGLARVAGPTEPPSMEVDFVEDIGLEAAAPTITPPASAAPEMGEADLAEPTRAVAAPPLSRAPSILPTPEVNAAERRKSEIDRTRAQLEKAQPSRAAPRVSRLDDDFLKGIKEVVNGPSKSAPTFSAQAKASIGQAILRQVKPCADRQPYIGEGANQIRLTVNLRLTRTGRLARTPTILGAAGDSSLRSKYGELLEDQVRRIFTECTPLRLPAELYETPTGGWGNFTFTYRVD
jgi:hypothetical protein